MLRAPTGLSTLLLMAGLLASAAAPQPQQHAFAAAAAVAVTVATTQTVTSWPPPPTHQLQSAADLWAVCGKAAVGPLCPPPCPANSTKNTQCLYYLKESHKEEVCGPELGPERRRDVLHGLRMRHCCEHAVDAALPHQVYRGGDHCRRLIQDLLDIDELATRISCSHHQVLHRYDCGQNYSNVHHCMHCKQAYRRWVCSSLVPHFTRGGERVLPCLSVCQDVEQQCPYLLPGDWTNQTIPPGEAAHPTPQYAGEPTFLCLDPNIPETGEQRLKSSRGDEDCCYTHCGSPGRGPVLGEALFGVCEHCPGRPSVNETTPSAASPSSPSSRTSAAAATTSSASAATSRTIKKVSPLWTAWTILLIIIIGQKHNNTQTIYYASLLLRCLLVLCVTSVRTTTPLISSSSSLSSSSWWTTEEKETNHHHQWWCGTAACS